MKKRFFISVILLNCGMYLFAQDPTVKIILNDEERFRFEQNRISFLNPGENVFIGDSSGNFNNNGYHNVFIGSFSGFNNDSGYMNTYVGYRCGFKNIGGVVNSFYGRLAGQQNTTGSENTYLGGSAGRYSPTGSFNTYLGRAAGLSNLSGSGNVFIGYFAGANDTSSNRLIIANSNTPDPLIFGEFDNQMLRFNATRIEMRNPLGNTILGDSSGRVSNGERNVFVGSRAGFSNTGGRDNIFIGSQAGYSDTTGSFNVFIGTQTGWLNTTGNRNTFIGVNAGYANTTGLRNTFVGLSAGGSNTTGSYNTYVGRIAGWLNQTGDSNVFIGNAAGQYEMGSGKLYIANSETAEPLIYGDFSQKKLKFNADTVVTTGEVRSNQRFNVNGLAGINDTLNQVTGFDFKNDKLKYRTSIYAGGIITYMSNESEWADSVGGYLLPCGEISLIGEFNDWAGDLFMTRNAGNPDLWATTIKLTAADEFFSPPDSIIEMKFREDGSWVINWGEKDFPTGTGIQDGPNIPVPLDDADDTTLYYVTFNCRTGEYSFENLTGFCGDSLTDSRDGKNYATVLIGNQCWMAQDLNIGTRIDGDIYQTDNDTIEKYCYDNLEDNCNIWGGLYLWPELMEYSTIPGVRGICPTGWHVPDDNEFKILEGNVDSHFGIGDAEWNKIGWRGYDAGLNLRAANGWNGIGNGTDAFGFHAIPGGYYLRWGDDFYDSGSCNQYFTSTYDETSNMSFIRHMNGDVGIQITRNTNSTEDGCSLRCLKDK